MSSVDLGPDRHDLQRDDVALASRRSRPEVVGEAEPVVLGWRGKTRRPSSRSRSLRVEDDQLVAVGGAREVAERARGCR